MDGKVRAACVMGWPAKQSRSPMIHNHWVREHGVAGEYRIEEISPEDFPGFLQTLAAHGYVGGNVTMPHKGVALELSSPDARARAVGAANTVWIEEGRLHSTNTDVEGFLGNLDASAPGWDSGLDEAVVLGAGGAARAVVYGLVERGAKRIHVVNRTFERASELRERFGDSVRPARWSDVAGVLTGAGLIVNATSLGMAGKDPLRIDLSPAPKAAVVNDLIYVPLKTGILEQAENRGMRTADGLGMLLHQAGRGFELWFGVRPSVTADLRALVERDLVSR